MRSFFCSCTVTIISPPLRIFPRKPCFAMAWPSVRISWQHHTPAVVVQQYQFWHQQWLDLDWAEAGCKSSSRRVRYRYCSGHACGLGSHMSPPLGSGFDTPLLINI